MDRTEATLKHKQKAPRKVPHSFVLALLDEANPYTRPMFGCISVYIEDKIVLILREKSDYIRDNGIWVATTIEHHASLKREFPSLRSIELFGGNTTGWQNLPVDAPDFEDAATRLCEVILHRDPRVGKVPKPRSKSRSKATPLTIRKGARVKAAFAGKSRRITTNKSRRKEKKPK